MFEFTHRQRGEVRKMQCRNNGSYRGVGNWRCVGGNIVIKESDGGPTHRCRGARS
jgi:hypothetical protein